jgi:hypothetical protein
VGTKKKTTLLIFDKKSAVRASRMARRSYIGSPQKCSSIFNLCSSIWDKDHVFIGLMNFAHIVKYGAA